MQEFWAWWQNLPLNIDPVIFEIGSFRLHYYGLMYLAAFGLTYFLAAYRIKSEPRWKDFTKNDLQELLTVMIIGLIVGARLGYVIIYNLSYFLKNPIEIFLPFQFKDGFEFTGIAGMSYHGGLAGTILCAIWYLKKHKKNIRNIADLLIPCIPAGYTFGRLGNFINGELWGRVTSLPIGMYFPGAGASLRHPSQLYEAFGEGIFLFAVLWPVRNKIKTPGVMLGLYLIGYGMIRFMVEYLREPDSHIGFVFLSFSMGQILCGLMITAGLALILAYKRLASVHP
ncbi:MAG: prolipoprotein diacylglyceryl transferase [Desulfobacteraceae bacterium]|nr:prolipoprotein diacylglyceryl transferase [Desulfobacteraceae bacterium]